MFYVIQNGYAILGKGETIEEAKREVEEWDGAPLLLWSDWTNGCREQCAIGQVLITDDASVAAEYWTND
jgi:hypothetical protein